MNKNRETTIPAMSEFIVLERSPLIGMRLKELVKKYGVYVLDKQENKIKAIIIQTYSPRKLSILFNKQKHEIFFDSNWYETLRNLDNVLNRQGFKILCNGTSKGVYPSGFCTNMGDGSTCYDFRKHSSVKELLRVNTLEYSDWNEYTNRIEQEISVGIKRKEKL